MKTITIWTHDFGPIRVPDPVWCVADHKQVVGFRQDIQHESYEAALQVRTERHGLMEAMPVRFTQRPYSPHSTQILVEVEVDEYHGFDAEELELIATALEKHAAVIRVFARELPKLREAGS